MINERFNCATGRKYAIYIRTMGNTVPDRAINKGKNRAELIAKDPKSAEIIRPILRGRDIQRNSYEFANLYMICTFPSKHYDIDKFPAIKAHLENFGKSDIKHLEKYGQDCYGRKRLGQTGDSGCRKKTNNKWFETQDSISYWDEFSKPKLMYSEIVQEPKFYLDPNGQFYNEATSFLMTGEHLKYLQIMLHSKLMTFAFKTFYAGGGLGDTGIRYKKAFLELLPILIPDANLEKRIVDGLHQKWLEQEICQTYCLTEEEINFIENQ